MLYVPSEFSKTARDHQIERRPCCVNSSLPRAPRPAITQHRLLLLVSQLSCEAGLEMRRAAVQGRPLAILGRLWASCSVPAHGKRLNVYKGNLQLL